MCSFHRLSGLTSLIWERVWDKDEKVKVEGVDFLHPNLASWSARFIFVVPPWPGVHMR